MRRQRVLFSVCGEGLGHAVASLPIMKELSRDCEVKALSWGNAMRYLQGHGFDVSETLPDYQTFFVGDRVDLKKTSNLRAFLKRTKRAMELEDNVMKDFKPDLVYSDSKVSTCLLARRYHVPCIIVTNQISLHKRLPLGINKMLVVPFIGISFALVSKSRWIKRVLIRDYPPPDDITRGAARSRNWTSKMRYVGFMVPWESPRHKMRRGNVVLCGLSGASLKTDFLKVLKEVAETSGYEFRVLGAGNRHGLRSSKRVKVLPFLDDRRLQREFERADVYLGVAGYNTVACALSMGMPVVTTYPENHLEQRLNSMNCERLGVGVNLGPHPDGVQILRAVERVFSDASYFHRARAYQRLYRRLNGGKEAVREARIILKERRRMNQYKLVS